jgi:hypothetical protein
VTVRINTHRACLPRPASVRPYLSSASVP